MQNIMVRDTQRHQFAQPTKLNFEHSSPRNTPFHEMKRHSVIPDFRKHVRELKKKKLNEENEYFLRRLQEQTSVYDVQQWKQDRRENKELLKLRCRWQI